ncbi:MAG: cation diffusion facilitator family transporter [Candidatus Aegiribacteria sp.]|nr:cation diffusion facilitator family transporter [Candidatus Aegiribacteria sp.]
MNGFGENEVLRRTTRITLAGLILNVFLSGFKLAGGILSSSHALVADGVHSLSDCVTDVAILIGAKFWTKPSDANHPHGHARIETIIAGFIGLFIIFTGLYIAWKSFGAIMNPPVKPPDWPAFAVAMTAILAKGILSRWTLRTSRKLKSPALAANAMHQRSDAVSSIPVAVVVLAARIDHSLVVLDGIGGVFVSIFILKLGINIFQSAMWQLSDTAAPTEIIEELRRIALSVDGVADVHNLRTRYQGDGIQADMHIVVDGRMPLAEAFFILKEVERNLCMIGPGVVDVLVRLEPD